MAKGTQGLSGLAARYATALYELAAEQKALDQVADDLRQLKALLDESADLTRLVRSPMIGRDDQAKAITAVMEKAGASRIAVNFVGTIARNRRLFALRHIIDAFLAELAARRGEVTAEVVSAKKLTEKQLKDVTDALKSKEGAQIVVETRVDPAIIGGLVVKVGSRMMDNSLRTKLQRLQHAMKGVG